MEDKGKNRIRALLIQARERGVVVHDALLYGAMEVFESLSIDYSKMLERQWMALTNLNDPNDASVLFLLSLFRFLVLGLTLKSATPFQKSLQTYFSRLEQAKTKLLFLSLVWNNPDAPDSLKIVALKMGSLYLEQAAAINTWAIQYESSVVPQLLCCLTSSNQLIRQHALAIFKVLGSSFSTSSKTYGPLIVEIHQAGEELKIDEEQAKVVLARHLSKKTALSTSKALFDLLVLKDVPDYVKQGLLKALEQVNSADILTRLLPLIEELVNKADTPLRAIESNVLTMLLERFNSESAPIIAKDEGWKCFQKV